MSGDQPLCRNSYLCLRKREQKKTLGKSLPTYRVAESHACLPACLPTHTAVPCDHQCVLQWLMRTWQTPCPSQELPWLVLKIGVSIATEIRNAILWAFYNYISLAVTKLNALKKALRRFALAFDSKTLFIPRLSRLKCSKRVVFTVGLVGG